MCLVRKLKDNQYYCQIIITLRLDNKLNRKLDSKIQDAHITCIELVSYYTCLYVAYNMLLYL